MLNGIRIVDLTSVIVGPACTWRLAQYGAEVIKVESPEGDLMRELGGASRSGHHSGAYLHLNRGKKNISLDLKATEDRDVLDKLIETADVFVANMRPNALKRLKLDAYSLRATYPKLVHCTITGYGSDGPYSGQPTYDSVVQGVAGVAALAHARDGEPAYVPLMLCDHVSGEIAAGAILAALFQRRATGEGVSIEVPMFETMAAFVLQEHLAQETFIPPVGPVGDQRLLNADNRPVQTADGWISFTINTDKQVRAFLEVTERQHLVNDERFATVAARAEHVREWFAVRGASLASRTTAQWLSAMQKADIAAQPCHTLDSLQKDPHLLAVGLLKPEFHPMEREVWSIRSSILVNGASLPAGKPASAQGAENSEIIAEVAAAM